MNKNKIQAEMLNCIRKKGFDGIESRIAWETVAWIEQARIEAD